VPDELRTRVKNIRGQIDHFTAELARKCDNPGCRRNKKGTGEDLCPVHAEADKGLRRICIRPICQSIRRVNETAEHCRASNGCFVCRRCLVSPDKCHLNKPLEGR
jgi:hypothetical protein